jgi:hypothetical protein
MERICASLTEKGTHAIYLPLFQANRDKTAQECLLFFDRPRVAIQRKKGRLEESSRPSISPKAIAVEQRIFQD